MKNKKTILSILSLAFLFLMFGAGAIQAQPSDAQLKKVLTGPKTVSVTLSGPGKVEWDSAYKKYIWTRYFTAKLKTDTPGETLVVKGFAAYDVMGGRYVYWRTFTSGNNYEGKKNPPIAEINQLLGKLDLNEFERGGIRNFIGEYESFRIAPDADWEWHTPDSVSFNVVAVYHVIYDGRHYEEKDVPYQYQAGFKAVDKVESLMRLRLYRKPNSAWDNLGVRNSIRDPQDRRYLKQSVKLLERKVYPEAEVEQMPRLSKVPLLTQ